MLPYSFQRFLRLYVGIAVALLFATLWLPITGEEGVYILSAFENVHAHQPLTTTLFGDFYGRPPLLSWLLGYLAEWMSWHYAVVLNRLLSALSTVLIAAGLFGLSKRVSTSTALSWLTVAAYLSGDLLLRRGWLAYADPLLSLCVFLSFAALWLALEQQYARWLWLAAIATILGFLSKALTAYTFYAVFWLVLFCVHQRRRYLFSVQALLSYAALLLVPYGWDWLSGQPYWQTMLAEMSNTAFAPGIWQYLYQVGFYQPVMLVVHLLPLSVFVIYGCYQRNKPSEMHAQVGRIAFWVALLGFIPCWFAPRWPEARYYMPLYPAMALFMAQRLWACRRTSWRWLQRFLMAFLLIKALSVVWFYSYQSVYRMNYREVAEAIVKQLGSRHLVVDPLSQNVSTMNSVGMWVDVLRPSQPPLQLATAHWQGCLLSHEVQPNETLSRVFRKHREAIYIYCRPGDLQSTGH